VREDGEPTRSRAVRAEFSDEEWRLVSARHLIFRSRWSVSCPHLRLLWGPRLRLYPNCSEAKGGEEVHMRKGPGRPLCDTRFSAKESEGVRIGVLAEGVSAKSC
jgi:hypothetical protein